MRACLRDIPLVRGSDHDQAIRLRRPRPGRNTACRIRRSDVRRGDGNLLAANTVASPAASSGGSASISDPADSIDDDAVREPMATPEPAPRRTARQQPDPAHPPGQHVPAHAGSATHKKAEATRWQSLLPGVMK
jgi:hypothetical protein